MANKTDAQYQKTATSRKARRVLFGLDLHGWEQWMLGSLAFAGIAAVAVFLTTASVVFLQRSEAEKAREELTAARERIVGLQAQTETARSEIARATERAAEATSKAEAERLQRMRLEAEIAPRAFSVMQLETIARRLKEYSGRKVTLGAYSMDLEAVELGRQISEALESAGIVVERASMTYVGAGEPIVGIEVYGPDAKLAAALISALSVPPRIVVSNPGSVNRPPVDSAAASTVWIGVKPLPKIK